MKTLSYNRFDAVLDDLGHTGCFCSGTWQGTVNVECKGVLGPVSTATLKLEPCSGK